MSNWQSRIVKEATVDPALLLEHPDNWRRHPQAQRVQLEAVLEGIGWIQSVVVSERTGRILDGHLRVDLAKGRGESVPVSYVDLSEEEERAALATFDFISSQAESDKESLERLLQEIEKGNGLLLESLRPAIDAVIAEFKIGRLPGLGRALPEALPRTVETGDLWQIGDHRLLCGDSSDPVQVERLLEGASPLLLVTDPPYGVSYDPTWRDKLAEQGLIDYPAARIGTFEDGGSDISSNLRLSRADVAYIWHEAMSGGALKVQLESLGFEVRSQIVWAKSSFAISRGHYNWQHETCFYCVRKGSSANWIGDATESTLWRIESDPSLPGVTHSTQKPLELFARAIRNHGGAGAVVYDPFLGSGTTLVAAHRERRICYGIELDPSYCDMVLERARLEGLEIKKGDS